MKPLPILLLLLTACTGDAALATAGSCSFKVDKNVIEQVIIPTMSKTVGAAYVYFNFDDPAVIRHGDRVELVFDPVRTVNGQRRADENGFVIVIEACSHKVTESYETLNK